MSNCILTIRSWAPALLGTLAVAGVTIGQDISDRPAQFAASPPHFDLGKSYDTFGPIGPVIVSTDELADRDALHVRRAGEAYLLGPGPAPQSYLAVDRLMEAIERSGAEAVHPGYGFLAENAAFARRLEEAGIAFIGPPVGAIAAMGDKIESKKLAAKA